MDYTPPPPEPGRGFLPVPRRLRFKAPLGPRPLSQWACAGGRGLRRLRRRGPMRSRRAWRRRAGSALRPAPGEPRGRPSSSRRPSCAAAMVGREKELKIRFVPGCCELVEVSASAGNSRSGGVFWVRSSGGRGSGSPQGARPYRSRGPRDGAGPRSSSAPLSGGAAV